MGSNHLIFAVLKNKPLSKQASMNRPIREWYKMLPEPLCSEANAARDRAEERDPEWFTKDQTSKNLVDALLLGFFWGTDGGDDDKWHNVHRRALEGEFNSPSEIDLLRARMAELEEGLRVALGDLKQAQEETHIDFRGSIDVVEQLLNKS